MEVLEKVTSNIELLENIFKFLTLKEQIQMISVCKEFEYIIENFLWKGKFNEIKIIEINDTSDITFNDDANNVYNLTESESQTFFTIMAQHIQKLIKNNRNKDKLIDLYKFENLILIEFNRAIVTEDNFKYLSINCPKLETINLINCNDERYNTGGCFDVPRIDLGRYSQIKHLAKVKSLRNLKLAVGSYLSVSWLTNIFKQLSLTSLSVDVYFYEDDEELKVENFKNCQTLKHLDLCLVQEAWLQFENLYLKNFVNLTTLTLSCGGVIFRDSNLVTLATTCNKLQELSFFEWGLQIKQFPQQFKLKKLKLKYCKYLTWTNLQQILRELKLEEFISENTEYEGSCDLSYATCAIANTLKILDIKTKKDPEFLKFINYVNDNKPENLITFRYEFIEYVRQRYC